MNTRCFGAAAVGIVSLALFVTGCNLIDFDRRNLQNEPPPPTDMPAEEPRLCTPVVAETTPEYEAMCRHYCNELEATLTYAGQNQTPAGALSQSCYELRCARGCVSHDLCTMQCHAIGFNYQGLCSGVEIAPDTVCPVTIDERVATCLAGCDLWVGPGDDSSVKR
jgi:hypothetical protein